MTRICQPIDSPQDLFKIFYEIIRYDRVSYSSVCILAIHNSTKFGRGLVIDLIKAAEKAQQDKCEALDTPLNVRLGFYKGMKQRSENMNNW